MLQLSPQSINDHQKDNKKQFQNQQNCIVKSNKNQKNCQIKKELPLSVPITLMIIDQIIQECQQMVRLRKIVKNNIQNFSYKYSKSIQEQIVHQYLNKFNQLQKLIQQKQPSPLIKDNLNPIFAQIQYKKRQKSQSQQIESKYKLNRNLSISKQKSASLISQEIIKQKKTLEEKANAENALRSIQNETKQKQIQTSEDKMIQAMRIIQIQKSSYRNQSDNKKNRNKKDMLKKDQKISYDYQGQIVKVKTNNKSNFVSNSLATQTNLPTIKLKQTKGQLIPIIIDNPLKRDLLKRNMTKKGSDIEFSLISNLANQVKVLDGVKFVSGKTTLQNKEKTRPVNQLKKNISNQNLSRNQFQRLKSLGSQKTLKPKNSSVPLLPKILRSQPNLQNLNHSILNSSALSSKFDTQHISNKPKSLQRQKIMIQNQQLVEYLLQKVNNGIQETFLHKKLTTNSKQYSQSSLRELSLTDRANLNYIKTGSVGIIDYISLKKKTPSIYKKQKESVSSIHSINSIHDLKYNNINDLKYNNKSKQSDQKLVKTKQIIEKKLKI